MGISLRETFWITLFAVTSFSLSAQVKSIRNVHGEATIINITPEEAKQKAVDAAKAEALRLAGAQEWIQAFDFLDKKEINKTVEEYFQSMTSVQTMGSVLSWKLIRENKRIDDNRSLVYEVDIDAEVKLYQSRPDPEFTISVSGVAPVYKNEESLHFTITPLQSGYLTIFNVDQQSVVTQLYPNSHEPMFALEPGKTYSFPQSPYFEYEVYTDLKEEVNHLFFLFTRHKIAFKSENFASFIEQTYQIEPKDRYLALEKIRIVK
jgi:hypothetical protein